MTDATPQPPKAEQHGYQCGILGTWVQIFRPTLEEAQALTNNFKKLVDLMDADPVVKELLIKFGQLQYNRGNSDGYAKGDKDARASMEIPF